MDLPQELGQGLLGIANAVWGARFVPAAPCPLDRNQRLAPPPKLGRQEAQQGGESSRACLGALAGEIWLWPAQLLRGNGRHA